MSSKLPEGEDLFVERRTKRRTRLKKQKQQKQQTSSHSSEPSLLDKLISQQPQSKNAHIDHQQDQQLDDINEQQEGEQMITDAVPQEEAPPKSALLANGMSGSLANLLAFGGVDGEEEEEEEQPAVVVEAAPANGSINNNISSNFGHTATDEGSTGEEGDSLDSATLSEEQQQQQQQPGADASLQQYNHQNTVTSDSGSSSAAGTSAMGGKAANASRVHAAANTMRQLWNSSLQALQQQLTPTSVGANQTLPAVQSHREQFMRTSNAKLRKRLVDWAVAPYDAAATNARVMLRSADDATQAVVSLSSSVVSVSKALGAIELSLEHLPHK